MSMHGLPIVALSFHMVGASVLLKLTMALRVSTRSISEGLAKSRIVDAALAAAPTEAQAIMAASVSLSLRLMVGVTCHPFRPYMLPVSLGVELVEILWYCCWTNLSRAMHMAAMEQLGGSRPLGNWGAVPMVSEKGQSKEDEGCADLQAKKMKVEDLIPKMLKHG